LALWLGWAFAAGVDEASPGVEQLAAFAAASRSRLGGRGPKSDATFQPGARLNQETKGIPGTREVGDRFGAAHPAWLRPELPRRAGRGNRCPGEDIGKIVDAGSLTRARCPARAG
jgi:hypothetical protein